MPCPSVSARLRRAPASPIRLGPQTRANRPFLNGTDAQWRPELAKDGCSARFVANSRSLTVAQLIGYAESHRQSDLEQALTAAGIRQNYEVGSNRELLSPARARLTPHQARGLCGSGACRNDIEPSHNWKTAAKQRPSRSSHRNKICGKSNSIVRLRRSVGHGALAPNID